MLSRYNNGNRTSSVTWEHGILTALAALPLPPPPFEIPCAVPPIKSSPHFTFVELSDGACACVFKKIRGALPKLSHVKSIGAAAGHISVRLAAISHIMASPSPTPPYHNLYKAHHCMSRKAFFDRISNADLDLVRSDMTSLGQAIERIEQKIAEMHELQLPEQVLHLYTNYNVILI
jgi:hypothetical protein